MKKYFILFAFCLSLAGCQRGGFIASSIASSNPIMPIRMASDTQHVVLTDYVPLLFADTSVWYKQLWISAEPLECINLVGTPNVVRELDLINHDRSIHALRFIDHKGSFAIPVLPNKPVRQALVSLGYKNGLLRVGFTQEVSNPSFEAYIQNYLIDHSLWNANDDGTWTLDIASLAVSGFEFSGRSFLRIFAEDETYLYNDLLLPLQDGRIITNPSQLNRHDQQAQVLYSVLIDRFFDGNTANDWKLNSPEVLDIVDYQGGDLAGITKKISEGYFDSLGVNTLWISPITQNPWDAWGLYPFPESIKQKIPSMPR